MLYIETFHRQVEGNGITTRYLNSRCVVYENRHPVYRNINYADTFRPDYAREMCELLGDVQHNLCCYCMRLLPKGSPTATLEHIIPQSSSPDEFDRYINLGYNELSEHNLIHTDKFSGQSVTIPTPPLPHTVAYHNFLISCDGSFVPDNNSHLCCNNARENKFINPIFFIDTINEEIEYTPYGKIRAKDESGHKAEIESVISAARLNCDTLREMRHIWYCFRNLEINTLQNAAHSRKERIVLLLKYCNADNNIKTKYSRPYKWELLLSFAWYHSYYNSHYS